MDEDKTNPITKLHDALRVLTLDPDIRSWLTSNDPMALVQAEQALRLIETVAPSEKVLRRSQALEMLSGSGADAYAALSEFFGFEDEEVERPTAMAASWQRCNGCGHRVATLATRCPECDGESFTRMTATIPDDDVGGPCDESGVPLDGPALGDLVVSYSAPAGRWFVDRHRTGSASGYLSGPWDTQEHAERQVRFWCERERHWPNVWLVNADTPGYELATGRVWDRWNVITDALWACSGVEFSLVTATGGSEFRSLRGELSGGSHVEITDGDGDLPESGDLLFPMAEARVGIYLTHDDLGFVGHLPNVTSHDNLADRIGPLLRRVEQSA